MLASKSLKKGYDSIITLIKYFKKNNQHLSVEGILGFPAAVHGEGGTDIANPTFKFGVSYARNFDFKFLKNNFYF